ELVAEQLNAVNTDEVGVLASSRATTEELYLLQKLMRAKGINNIDHRLRQTDFTDQAKAPQFPWLGMPINALETVDAILLVGADIRHDQPMANHWLRKAALKGAKVSVLSSCPIDFNYPLDRVVITDPVLMVSTLGQVLSATGNVSKALSSLTPAADEQAKVLAETLRNAENAVILLGNQAVQHPAFSQLRALSAELASNTGATLSYLSESANTVGAWLTGIVPHRLAGGVATKTEGLHSADMLMSALKTLVLFDVEPTFDCDDPQKAIGALDHAKVIAFTSFASEQLRASVDILLPISTFAETSGTYINAEGKQQSFRGVAKAPADVKPGWRILRVLGGVLELDGFEYMSSKDVLDEFNQTVSIVPDNTYNLDDNDDFSALSIELDNHSMLQRIGAVHMYSGDSLVRRATALQKTFSIARDAVRIHPSDVKKLGISGEESVVIQQGDGRVVMSLVEDPSIPEGCVHLLSATSKATALGASYGHVTVQGGS
ncbi:MAG TPA: NADH-quinone oxidoreductase subunit G, partial [Thiothrix sp.]|nr:NADH-quinone oxidoreductase subunit G [Thiothrix sp.]